MPISSTENSANLRVAHAQRVISAQLQNIIWQPFSSETTLQNPKYVSLLSQISEGLIEYYGKPGGLRVTRICSALALRGIQSQPSTVQPSSTSKPPLPGRAQVFCDKVMAVLSFLVNPSLHSSFRKSLLDLAVSAISVWDIAQTDEREVIVDPNLDPAGFEGWHEDIPEPCNRVLVLFPRITARSYSRTTDSRPVGPPGGWVDSEPKLHIEETCIYDGTGLAKWSEVVTQGEEEEEERKVKEQNKMVEDKRRTLEEDLKKLKNSVIGTRRMSQNKRDSTVATTSKPSTVWIEGGGQKINEGVD